LIDNVKIDAKHSNEDDIAPFNVWLEKYGNRIGNFGGIDMNVVVLKSPLEIKEYVKNVYHYSKGYKGIAIGTGNQISPYVPPENFIGLTEAVRECWI
jgi:uroporphyrinogen decarboxylase